MKRMLAIMIAVLILTAVFAIPVYANSAQKHWRGVDSTGAMVIGEHCPIEVERELLIFDVSEFPETFYLEKEAYLAYTGKVTAEYTFYNPTDLTVTATLAFPFGKQPDYVNRYDNSEIYLTNMDIEKYDIKVNGEAIARKIRYTLKSDHQFVLSEDLPKLSEDYIIDDFYSPAMTVTKYTYIVGGSDEEGQIDRDQYRVANVAFDWDGGDGKSRIYFPEQSGFHIQKDGDGRFSTWADNGDRLDVYVFGQPLSVPLAWKCYEDSGANDKEEIDGAVVLTDIETMTLEDFALGEWREDLGVSRIDWYNAVIAALLEGMEGQSKYNYIDLHSGVGLSADRFMKSLMRWYEYEITLAPGESIVNTVTAPIYPAINMDYDPEVFSYTYLLSPASTWRDFGELEIRINTPFFITETSHEGWTKTALGYAMQHKGLPDGELSFTLCSVENPEKPNAILKVTGVLMAFLSAIGVFIGKIMVSILILLLITLLLLKLVREIKRKRTE